jgi:hypothetical protein
VTGLQRDFFMITGYLILSSYHICKITFKCHNWTLNLNPPPAFTRGLCLRVRSQCGFWWLQYSTMNSIPLFLIYTTQPHIYITAILSVGINFL